jgi:predicted site-specific integrase-resolvase
MIHKYHRRYARHVRRCVRHECKAEYESWMARLQQALDCEELVNDFNAQLESFCDEHPTDIRECGEVD